MASDGLGSRSRSRGVTKVATLKDVEVVVELHQVGNTGGNFELGNVVVIDVLKDLAQGAQ